MTSLQSAVCTLPGYIVYFASFLLTAAHLTVLLACLRTKQSAFHAAAALLYFLAGFFLLSVLLNDSYYVALRGETQTPHDFERRLLSIPWLMYVGAELVSAAVTGLQIRAIRRYRSTHLGADAIRQTVDLLPTAVMISDPDGTVLLSNLKMTELCRILTGELLSDAGRFRQRIESSEDGDHLIHTPDGETWQFRQSSITLNEKTYDQLTASDMTEKYRVTKELMDNNERLRAVQYRMRAVAARERSLIAAREVMNARRTVHDRMGGVLLSGKYYLDHPEDVKEEELLRLMEYSNRFLLSETEQPEPEGDPLEEALRMAKRIGVSVEMNGAPPKNANSRALIAQAIDQCASNAVRHAGGDRVAVEITERDAEVTASFSNNGSPPKGPITETGGLAVLRKAIEDAGGAMRVESAPRFLLSISIPTKA